MLLEKKDEPYVLGMGSEWQGFVYVLGYNNGCYGRVALVKEGMLSLECT